MEARSLPHSNTHAHRHTHTQTHLHTWWMAWRNSLLWYSQYSCEGGHCQHTGLGLSACEFDGLESRWSLTSADVLACPALSLSVIYFVVAVVAVVAVAVADGQSASVRTFVHCTLSLFMAERILYAPTQYHSFIPCPAIFSYLEHIYGVFMVYSMVILWCMVFWIVIEGICYGCYGIKPLKGCAHVCLYRAAPKTDFRPGKHLSATSTSSTLFAIR